MTNIGALTTVLLVAVERPSTDARELRGPPHHVDCLAPPRVGQEGLNSRGHIHWIPYLAVLQRIQIQARRACLGNLPFQCETSW